MKTKVICFFGASSTGKSTIASALNTYLKLNSHKVEYAHEFVKQLAWEGRFPDKFQQIQIFGEQSRIESRLYNKVEYIVTDSPLWLIPFYEKKIIGKEIIKPAVKLFIDYVEGHNVEFINFWLEKPDTYHPEGRYETKEESAKTHDELYEFLKEEGLNLIHLPKDHDERMKIILAYLFPEMKKQKTQDKVKTNSRLKVGRTKNGRTKKIQSKPTTKKITKKIK